MNSPRGRTGSAAAGWGVDRSYRGLSAALAVLSLALALLPPGLLFTSGDSTGELERNVLSAVQWPLLFIAGAWLLVRRYRLALRLLPWIGLTLPLLLGWFLASVLWSAAPAETARRATRLLALALCAYAYGLASWQPGRYWRHARYTLGVIAGLSVVVALLVPEIGTHGPASPEAGKWRGLTTNKNILGPAAAIGFLLWLHAWASGELLLRRALPWLAACALALLGTRSSSSLLGTVLCAAILLLYLRPPIDLRGRRLPFAVALLLALALPLQVEIIWHGPVSITDVIAPVAELAGKDVSLTGRSDVWRYLIEEIPLHPWLGVGHGAYWLGEWSLSDRAVRELYWIPNQGHNFYLDLLNETGIIGVALFAALLVSWIRAIRRVAALDRPGAVLNGVLLLFLLVHGITETAMLRAITPLTVLMLFALFDVRRRLFEAELAAHGPALRPAEVERV